MPWSRASALPKRTEVNDVRVAITRLRNDRCEEKSTSISPMGPSARRGPLAYGHAYRS